MILTILVIIFIILNIADILLTNYILSRGGTELNPVMVWAQRIAGDMWYIPKFILVIVGVGVAYWLPINYGIGFIALADVVFAYVVWRNWQESRK